MRHRRNFQIDLLWCCLRMNSIDSKKYYEKDKLSWICCIIVQETFQQSHTAIYFFYNFKMRWNAKILENFNHQSSQHILILNWISSQTQIHKITNSNELFLNIFLIKCVCSYTGSKQNEQEIPYISQIKDNFKGFSTVIYFLEFHYSFNEL